MMSRLEQAYQFDIHIRRAVDEKLPAQGVAVEAEEIAEAVVYQDNGVKVTAFTVDHAPIKQALGHRIDLAGQLKKSGRAPILNPRKGRIADNPGVASG